MRLVGVLVDNNGTKAGYVGYEHIKVPSPRAVIKELSLSQVKSNIAQFENAELDAQGNISITENSESRFPTFNYATKMVQNPNGITTWITVINKTEGNPTKYNAVVCYNQLNSFREQSLDENILVSFYKTNNKQIQLVNAKFVNKDGKVIIQGINREIPVFKPAATKPSTQTQQTNVQNKAKQEPQEKKAVLNKKIIDAGKVLEQAGMTDKGEIIKTISSIGNFIVGREIVKQDGTYPTINTDTLRVSNIDKVRDLLKQKGIADVDRAITDVSVILFEMDIMRQSKKAYRYGKAKDKLRTDMIAKHIFSILRWNGGQDGSSIKIPIDNAYLGGRPYNYVKALGDIACDLADSPEEADRLKKVTLRLSSEVMNLTEIGNVDKRKAFFKPEILELYEVCLKDGLIMSQIQEQYENTQYYNKNFGYKTFTRGFRGDKSELQKFITSKQLSRMGDMFLRYGVNEFNEEHTYYHSWEKLHIAVYTVEPISARKEVVGIGKKNRQIVYHIVNVGADLIDIDKYMTSLKSLADCSAMLFLKQVKVFEDRLINFNSKEVYIDEDNLKKGMLEKYVYSLAILKATSPSLYNTYKTLSGVNIEKIIPNWKNVEDKVKSGTPYEPIVFNEEERKEIVERCPSVAQIDIFGIDFTDYIKKNLIVISEADVISTVQSSPLMQGIDYTGIYLADVEKSLNLYRTYKYKTYER